MPGGFKVLDASGQALAYLYARETPNEANIAGVLTFGEARRIAVMLLKLPGLLGQSYNELLVVHRRGVLSLSIGVIGGVIARDGF